MMHCQIVTFCVTVMNKTFIFKSLRHPVVAVIRFEVLQLPNGWYKQ